MELSLINKITKIDFWFLERIKEIIEAENYIKKHQSKSANDRLSIIVNEILNEGHIQKDDLTIVVLDGK